MESIISFLLIIGALFIIKYLADSDLQDQKTQASSKNSNSVNFEEDDEQVQKSRLSNSNLVTFEENNDEFSITKKSDSDDIIGISSAFDSICINASRLPDD